MVSRRTLSIVYLFVLFGIAASLSADKAVKVKNDTFWDALGNSPHLFVYSLPW